MDSKRKRRTILLALLTIFSVLVLMPTVLPDDQVPIWLKKRSALNKKIQLGLDLYGGLHIVYSIDLDKAVDDKATQIKRDLEAKFNELNEGKTDADKIVATVKTPAKPVGAVTIVVENPAHRARIDGKFLKDYDETVESIPCPEREEAARTVCLGVSSDYSDRIRASAMEQAIRTIRDRIDKRGIAQPTVVQKEDQIIVELPGDKETVEEVRELIERTAKLEFKRVDSGDDGRGTEYMAKLYAHVSTDPRAKELGIEARIDSWQNENDGQLKTFEDRYIQTGNVTRKVSVEEAKKRRCWRRDMATDEDGKVECKVQGAAVMREYLAEVVAQKPELKVDDDHQIGFELRRYTNKDNVTTEVWRTYYLWRSVELAGSAVTQAFISFDPTTNEPLVLLHFDRAGGRRWGDLTGANVGKRIAIILDDEVASAPTIQTRIDGGVASITMGARNQQEALKESEMLRDVLLTGSLPAPLREESSSIVGPLLGRDAVDKAKVAFGLGSLLVVFIMFFYYRTSGVISVVALVLNILFMIGALAFFGATLTLPGIAALVLTVGMAVDANIIIYERIREELRAGKSVKGAVEAGFARGFWAILDGQVTTLIAGLVLAAYGSGPIRGFAVMLIIGIFCTLFTAFWCTRLFFDYYVNRQGKATVIGI